MSNVWHRCGAVQTFQLPDGSHALVQSLWKTVKHGYILPTNNSTPKFKVTRRTATQRWIQPFITTEKCKQSKFQQENEMSFCLQQNQWTLRLNAWMWKNSRGKASLNTFTKRNHIQNVNELDYKLTKGWVSAT